MNEKAPAGYDARLAVLENNVQQIHDKQGKLEQMLRDHEQGVIDLDKNAHDFTIAQIAQLESRVRQEMAQLGKDLRAEMQMAIDGLDKRVKELNSKIDGLSQKTVELSGKLDLLSAQLATNALQMVKLTESVDEIKEMVSYLKGVWNTIKVAGPVIVGAISAVKWAVEHPDIIAKFFS